MLMICIIQQVAGTRLSRHPNNDISVLVQFIVKHINLIFEKEKALRNFIIETDDADGLTIKLKEF